QPRRDQRAAERFLRRLVRGQHQEPFRIVTDKLKSYGAAKRIILSEVTHDTRQYANNRAEVSHQHTRMRERHMRRFKSPRQAKRFLSIQSVVQNLKPVGKDWRTIYRGTGIGSGTRERWWVYLVEEHAAYQTVERPTVKFINRPCVRFRPLPFFKQCGCLVCYSRSSLA